MKIGLFTDIHFQEKGLGRIVSTGDWIIEEFQRRGVQHVINGGDSLNTREEVSVEAQSACTRFYAKMAEIWDVDVDLGNHDMNLKHAHHVSSMEPLALHPRITLHSKPAIKDLGGQDFLFLPYFEDQSQMVELLVGIANREPERAANMVVIAHAGINGAVQITKYNSTFSGATGTDVFAAFKRTFVGHFHVMQQMADRVLYMGSPLQFNFGDSGDERGVWVYDTETDEAEFILNPFYDSFQFISSEDVAKHEAGEIDLTDQLKDKFVTVIYDDVVTNEDYSAHQEMLETLGCLQVRKESVVERKIREVDVAAEVDTIDVTSVKEIVPIFVDAVLDPESALDRDKLVTYGQSIIDRVNGQFTQVDDEGAIFEGKLAWIMVENFLGAQQAIIINFSEMANGVWFFEGENGAGKSTLMEALVWTQFGLTIRSDMKAGDVINDVVGKNCRCMVGYENGVVIERFRKAGKGMQGYDNEPISGTGVKVYRNGVYQAEMEKGEPAATQGKINDMLGIDYEKFIKCIIIGQNMAGNFMTGDEKKRLAMIEEMIGMERFDDFLADVRDKKKELKDQADQQQSIQQIRAGELERTTHTITTLEGQIATGKETHQQQINTLGQNLVAIADETRKETAAWDERRPAVEQALEAAQAATVAAKAALDANASYLDTKAKAATLSGDIRAIDSAMTSMQGYADAVRQNDDQIDANVAAAETYLETLKARKNALAPLPDDFDPTQQASLARAEQGLQNDLRAANDDMNRAMHDKQDTANEGMRLEHSLNTPGQGCVTCGQSLADPQAIAQVQEAIKATIAQADEAQNREKAAHEAADKIRDQLIPIQEKLVDPSVIEGHRQADAEIATHTATVDNGPGLKESYSQQNRDLAVQLYTQVMGEGPSEIMRIQEMIDDLGTHRESKAREAQALLKDASAAGTKYAEAEQAHTTAVTEEAKAKVDVDTFDSQRASVMAVLAERENNTRTQLDQLKATNPTAALEAQLTQQQTSYQKVTEDLEKAKRLLVGINDAQAYVMFWDKAFAAKGSMRAFMMEDSARSLNELTVGYSNVLFDNGMVLTFNEQMQPVESFAKRSGGQRQRSRLAALFSVFELARQRTRYRANYLFLDEVFDALDTKGRKAVQDLLVVLGARLDKVLVITHADIAGTSMAGGIYAQMTGNGTTWTTRAI